MVVLVTCSLHEITQCEMYSSNAINSQTQNEYKKLKILKAYMVQLYSSATDSNNHVIAAEMAVSDLLRGILFYRLFTVIKVFI